MIRPITLLACFAAAGSGLYLYQTKLQAQLLDQRITRTVNEIRQVRQHTALLTAEYALLNDPQRLQKLSDEFLQLPPTAPTQYVTLADLGSRLPPVGPPPAPPMAPQEQSPPVAAPGTVPDAGSLVASAPEDSTGARGPATRDDATRVAIAREPSANPAPHADPQPAAARSVIAPEIATAPVPAPRPAPVLHLADAPAVRAPVVAHPAPSPVAVRYAPPPARVASARPEPEPTPRPAVLHPPGQAVSMLGMAWSNNGTSASGPGGSH